MSDYISRDGVLALAKEICVLTKWDSEYRHRSIDPQDVRELPAADVRENKRGRWNKTAALAPFADDEFQCSECGSWPWWCGVTDANLPNYCPNCGADMREEQT